MPEDVNSVAVVREGPQDRSSGDPFSDTELLKFRDNRRGFVVRLLGLGAGAGAMTHSLTNALAGTKKSAAFTEILAEFRKKPRPSYEDLLTLCRSKSAELLPGEILTLKGMLITVKNGGEIPETPAEKRQRLEMAEQGKKTDEILAEVSRGFFDQQNWGVDGSKGGICSIDVSRSKKLVNTAFIEAKSGKTAPKSTATFKMNLGSGKYKINATISQFNGVGIKLRDNAGNLTPAIKIESGKDVAFTIPPGYSSEVLFEVINNPVEARTTISSFSITRDAGGMLVASKPPGST